MAIATYLNINIFYLRINLKRSLNTHLIYLARSIKALIN
jgi:hypothetical protein